MGKTNENQNKCPAWLIVILIILIVALGCCITYIITKNAIEKEQQNATNVGQQSEISNTNIVLNESKPQNIIVPANNYLKEYVGKYHVDIGPDGYYDIEITEKNEKLDFKWTYGPFNDTYEIINVKEYNVQDNKLIVKIIEHDMEQEYIIYKDNNKMYMTISEAKDTYFPVVMEQK